MSALRDSAESAVPVGLRPPNHTTTRAPMSGAANESAHPTEPAVGRGQWPSRPCLDCLGWHVVHKRPRRAGPGGHASVGVRNGRVTWWGCGCRALVGLMPWPVVPAIERLMNCPHGGRYGASRYPEGPRGMTHLAFRLTSLIHLTHLHPPSPSTPSTAHRNLTPPQPSSLTHSSRLAAIRPRSPASRIDYKA
ncbi:hypothetical protein PTTG_26655 [Puccinia triticina 1-1 BBBD Race 1]|uniref:Uncharacterized protein n=1 Tax=Puccinia triticina (isolate 1-1 / race 1 (BBBD)) TaxID=630390 RepID=A0A180GSL1_PUCT1|nr:hypothetical protein PTTG_26655 [Puccinia triticina 1-1 BBBD Race 1]